MNLISSEIFPDFYESLELPVPLISVSKTEGQYIYSFLKEKEIKTTLEIGFCYGCSTAYIISATQHTHYAIDPHQEEVWNNVGLTNIKKLGMDKYLILEEDFSHNALPKLLKEGVKVDFCFIDGDHKFEAIILDFYYCNLLLNEGGYILFDDTYLRSTQVVGEWIKKNRADYKHVQTPSNVENFIMFQKIGKDERDMEHFVEFQ